MLAHDARWSHCYVEGFARVFATPDPAAGWEWLCAYWFFTFTSNIHAKFEYKFAYLCFRVDLGTSGLKKNEKPLHFARPFLGPAGFWGPNKKLPKLFFWCFDVLFACRKEGK